MDEFKLIEWFRSVTPKPRHGLGIGDDAALLSLSGKAVWTTDTIVEGVDFRLRELSPEWIGRKALAVNISDIAAMGASPRAFLVTFGFPAGLDEKWVKKCYSGIAKLARSYGMSLLGGDLTSSKDLFISISAVGEPGRHGPCLRGSAKVGDLIGVTGQFGGSIKKKHYSFTPRVEEAKVLAAYRPAMIDVSDGLAQDLGHILRASKCAAEIDIDALPVSREALQLSDGDSGKALKRALSDGEDFELLFTLSAGKKEKFARAWKRKNLEPVSWIGRVTRGKPGCVVWMRHGKKLHLKMSSLGYQHFKRSHEKN